MVPKGWKSYELQKICKKISVGLAISVTPFMRTEGVKLIRNQNIKRNYFNEDSVVYIDPIFADSNKSKKVKLGDVVAVRTGSNIGEACVIPKDFDGALTFTTLIARPDPNLLDSFYLSAHINSDYGIAEVNRLCAGGGKPNLNSGELKRYRILTPSLPEQKKIAKILSTWDKAITTTEQLLANNQQQKKALMQQLLTGKKRLLDNNGVRFSGEWTSFSLKGICKFIKDGTHGTHIRHESGVPMLSATNITKEGGVDFEGAPFISNEDYEKIHSKYQIESGDILITVVGTLGRVAVVQTESKFTLQRSVAILRIKERFSVQFMKQIFSTPEFTAILEKKSNSTAQAGVYLGELAKISIRIPMFEEQQKIAAVLSTADQEITALQQKLGALKQEKKALMQQLLTGKRRVKVEAAA